MQIVVSGASGLVGTAVVRLLEAEGHSIKRLVRKPVKAQERELFWNPAEGEIDSDALADTDAVIHLAAQNIADGRWTRAMKDRIRASRVDGTRLLAEAVAKLDPKPSVFVSAAAIGFYGSRSGEEMTESSAPGEGFLAEVCQAWEAAAAPAAEAGIRSVQLRIGVVLSKHGGALAKMLLPFKLGLGGVIGNGKQWMSWIELEDLARAIAFVLKCESLSGPINVVSPKTVTNREFTKTLGSVLHRPTLLPMPAFAARLAFGEMGEELLLASTRVSSARLLEAGFSFEQADLRGALENICKKPVG